VRHGPIRPFGGMLLVVFLAICIAGISGWPRNYAMIDDVEVTPSCREPLIRGREYDFEITIYYRGESADIQIFMSRFMEAPSGSSNIKCYLEETRAPGSGTVTLSFTAKVGEGWCNGALVVVQTSPAGGGNGDSEHISWNTVQAPIRFSWSPRNPAVGERVRFSAEVVDSTASDGEWIWRFRDGDDEVMFEGEGPNFTYTFNNAGDNYVQVKWDDRCGHRQAVSDYVHVTGSTPVAEFDWYPKDATAGEEVELESLAYDPDGDEIIAWWWYVGGDGPATGSYLKGEVVTYVFDSPGQKQIHHIIEDEHGLRGNIRTYITIGEGEAPEAHFSFEPSDPCTGSPVTFDARDSTGDIVYYEWDFDDGTDNEGARVSHEFDEPDHYSILLTVENEQGVRSIIIRGIDVVDCECANDFDEPILELRCSEPEFGESGATVAFSWFATDECTAPEDIKYRYKFGRDSWSRWGSDRTTTIPNLEDGYYTFCVEALDGARLSSQECCDIDVFANEFTEDDEPPHITLDCGDVECEEDGGRVHVSWTVTDNVSSPSRIYREFWLEDDDANILYESRRTRSVTGKIFKELTDGQYTFSLIAEDEEGKQSEIESEFRIDCRDAGTTPADTADPVIGLRLDQVECSTGGGDIEVSWTITDDVSPPRAIFFEYWLENDEGELLFESGLTRLTIDRTFRGLPDGEYVLTMVAEDEDGHRSDASLSFPVDCGDTYVPKPDPPRVTFSCEPQTSYMYRTAHSVQWETADERWGEKTHLGDPVPPPDRYFVDPERGYIYTHIYFDPVVDVAGSVDEITYEWDFGDGTSVRGSGAYVNSWKSNDYWASGEYTVTLTVTDGSGQSSTASSLVVIRDLDEDPVPGECPPGEIYTSLLQDPDSARVYGVMGWCVPSGEADTEGGLFLISLPISIYGGIVHTGSSWVRAIIEAIIEEIVIDKAIDAIE